MENNEQDCTCSGLYLNSHGKDSCIIHAALCFIGAMPAVSQATQEKVWMFSLDCQMPAAAHLSSHLSVTLQQCQMVKTGNNTSYSCWKHEWIVSCRVQPVIQLEAEEFSVSPKSHYAIPCSPCSSHFKFSFELSATFLPVLS